MKNLPIRQSFPCLYFSVDQEAILSMVVFFNMPRDYAMVFMPVMLGPPGNPAVIFGMSGYEVNVSMGIMVVMLVV